MLTIQSTIRIWAPCKSRMYPYSGSLVSDSDWRAHDDSWRLFEIAEIELMVKLFPNEREVENELCGAGR